MAEVDPFFTVWIVACDVHVPNKIFTGIMLDGPDDGCDECGELAEEWDRKAGL